MRFIKDVHLHNYLNIKHAKLEGLKDLNIIIGPNNCGKTSLLRAVDLLSRIEFSRTSPSYGCPICENVFQQDSNVHSARGSITVREKYLEKARVRAVFRYYRTEIEEIMPELSERQNKILTNATFDAKTKDHLKKEFGKERLVMQEQKGGGLLSEHCSPIIWDRVKERIFAHILFCPDERLQGYKEKSIPDYVSSKNLTASQESRIIKFLKDIIDPKMIDIHHNLDLVRDVENKAFTTSIDEQGSGVKSLFCLMADILSERQNRLVLIDEPELGLNPSGKHAFLKFLIEQSGDKQIFLATHDPTFVNPILWNRENVSVYMYSVINGNFVKVNLVQSKQDPSTFAGFLPHTTSLKQVHIYVEGTTDVYIFQMFLDKYVKERFKENWYHILSKIGIFHLAGDFWRHLLYTIPKRPYTSIVVLDGDKKEIAKEVVDKYGTIEMDRFQMFDSLDELKHEKRRRKPIIPMPCPIYCLKNSEIEDYLETRYETRPLFKEEGPSIAYEMQHVPPEIEQLFDAIFQMANIRNE